MNDYLVHFYADTLEDVACIDGNIYRPVIKVSAPDDYTAVMFATFVFINNYNREIVSLIKVDFVENVTGK